MFNDVQYVKYVHTGVVKIKEDFIAKKQHMYCDTHLFTQNYIKKMCQHMKYARIIK